MAIENITNEANETAVETTAEAPATVEEEKIKRPYTLRRLKDGDLFPLLGIVTKVFPEDLAKIFTQVVAKEKKFADIGMAAFSKLVFAIIKNLADKEFEAEVRNFLSDVSGISVEDMKEMEFGTTPMMIYDIFNDTKNTGFFKVLSKLL